MLSWSRSRNIYSRGKGKIKAKFRLVVAFLLFAIQILSSQSSWRICARIIDGDTIVIEENETIRLIGVDTSELAHPLKPVQYFAAVASEYVKNLALRKKVKLEYDQERTDKYGRTLAYVYFEDGKMLNAEIIKNGYGFAYTKYPFKYMEEFRKYEREAREKGLGLWGNQGTDEFYWVLAQNREPFIIYEMENNWWALKYKSYIKVRLTSEELKSDLDNLRIWINELNEKDLRQQLIRNGWKEETKK